MKSISQFRLKKIICQTEMEEEREYDFPEHVYASFLFKDRVTNSSFKFKEAIQNDKSSVDFKEWVQTDSKELPEFTHALRTYKFAKKFEMNCIRNKYLQKKNRKSTEKTAKTSSKTKEQRFSVRKNEVQKVKADEFRKTINQAGQSQNDTLGFMREKQQRRREKQATKWWKRSDVKKQQPNAIITLGENGQRVYDAAMTHLNYQVKERGEYLLNVPTLVKRRNLIKQQFKHTDNTFVDNSPQAVQRDNFEDKSPLKAVIESLQFSPFNRDQFKTLRQTINMKEKKDEKIEFLRLVRLGYLNQALIEVQKEPSIAQKADKEGNNAFHLCVKKGDETMCFNLFKNLPLRVCSKLLQSKNNLGRTPLQVAELLRQKKTLKIIIEYLKENKISFSGLSLLIDDDSQKKWV